MKRLGLFLFAFLAFALSSCFEEEAELQFSQTKVVNPENVEFRYFSPDPMHCPKMYEIEANYESSELILKCKNTNKIYIGNGWGSPNYFNSTEGQWTAELISPNTVKITFDTIDYDPDLDPEHTQNNNTTALSLAANTKEGKLSVYIPIFRYYYFSK